MARWFIESGIPQLKIDEYFNNGLSGGREGSFASFYTLRKLLAEMDSDMGLGSWKTAEVEFWSGTATYWYRDPIVIVWFLLQQRAFIKELVYTPIREYDSF